MATVQDTDDYFLTPAEKLARRGKIKRLMAQVPEALKEKGQRCICGAIDYDTVYPDPRTGNRKKVQVTCKGCGKMCTYDLNILMDLVEEHNG